ncbi:hypothetical protein D9M72_517750 [compost metagenome]
MADQAKRPAMLPIESSPTKPAATPALTRDTPSDFRKKSWIMGAACSRMPMPAVTLQNSATHTSQNCGVLIAFLAETFSVVTSVAALTLAGSNPAGRQPSAGTRMVRAPKSM